MSASRNNRGFTLMELLVVMAIIGVLAAIVLTSLNTSRTKAADAAIKANLKNSVVQAQVYFDFGTNTYDGVCALTGTRVIGGMVRSAEVNYDGGSTGYLDTTPSAWDSAQCHDSPTAWAAWVPLRASASGAIVAWCTDSTGASRQVSAPLTGPAGPSTQYTCP